MGVFDQDQVFGPRGGVLRTEEAEAGLQFLIHPFGLAVGLGVETRREAHRDAQQLAELSPETGRELRSNAMSRGSP